MDRLFQVAEAELIAVTSMEKKEMSNTSSPIFVRNDSTVSIPTVPSINAKIKFDSDDCKISVNKCETYCDIEQIFLSNAETMNTELSNDCISFCLKNKGSANVDHGNVHYGTNKGPVLIKAENETFSNCFHQNNPNTFSAIDENPNSNSAMKNVNKNDNVDSCLFSNSVVDEKNFSDFDHNAELDAVIDIGASNEIYVLSKRDVNTDINKIKNDLVFKDNNEMNCSLSNKIECCLHDRTRSAVNETNGGNYSESEKHVENGADQPEDNLMTGSFLFSLTKGIKNTESATHDSHDYESKSMCDELTTVASNSTMINTEFTLHGLSCESTNYRNKNCSNDINKKQTDLESACRDNFLLDETSHENEHVNISKKGTDDEKLIELPTGMISFENTGVLEHHSLRAQQTSKRRITSCEESFDRKKIVIASKHGHMEVKSINEEIFNIASNANFEKVHPSNTNNVEGKENSKNKIKNNTDLAEYQHNSPKFITIKVDWSNVNVKDGEKQTEIKIKFNLLKWKREKLDTNLLIKNLKDELELFKAAYKKSLDEIQILFLQLKFGKKQEIDISAKSEGFQDNNFCFISDISYLNQESKPKRKSQRTITKNELMRDNDEIKSSNDDKEDIKSITSVETVESSDSKISRITRRSANISKSDLLVENKLETLSLKNASAESLSKMSKTLSKKFVKDIC
ncbi:hypothetical protein HELRODRAFT_166872 [Helobdella robusta]|uniref:Uncharacterized protein n=1 Tax=Helobdella robusta TaxID=6412 RepID=T1EYP0_HELRO|nr:hypothetical protein HELRODRAFT_166872 [Helobdella robusta]ESO11820.1 hypothetical protein HELRODRAFT_166872 [Helobdella robusta]